MKTGLIYIRLLFIVWLAIFILALAVNPLWFPEREDLVHIAGFALTLLLCHLSCNLKPAYMFAGIIVFSLIIEMTFYLTGLVLSFRHNILNDMLGIFAGSFIILMFLPQKKNHSSL